MGTDTDFKGLNEPEREQPSYRGAGVETPDGFTGEPGDETAAGKPDSVSMEEHLERLAELNLSSAYNSRSSMSPAIIRMISAAAGVALLLLIYLLFKLFI